MIRSIIVQDLPPELRSLTELPTDWEPGILCSRQDVFQALRRQQLDVHQRHVERVRFEIGPGRFLEVILGPEELLFSFEIRFGESAIEDARAADLLAELGFTALDPADPSGLFRSRRRRSTAS